MYALINNSDNSINYINELPIEKNLCFEDVYIIEYKDKSVSEMLGAKDREHVYWNKDKELFEIFDFCM